MPETVGIGVVGAGMIAQRGILPHLSQDDVTDRVRLTAVCDVTPGRAQASADRYGIPKAYERYEDLLADPNVDMVTIATPIGLHYEHCKQALQAGKHVHANKTMTTTVAEADDLIATADAKALHISASPGEVLRAQVTRIRELIAEGAIGSLAWAICGTSLGTYHEEEEAEARASAPGGTPIDPSWYFRKPGGGPMYDAAVYPLHQLTSVLGPAKRVTALSGTVMDRREFLGASIETLADDNTILLLGYDGGAHAVVHGTVAGTLIEDFGAGLYFGTEGSIRGLSLNGEPFDFPGREDTLDAPTWDWETQMRVLPHVVGPHREIPESAVFEDIMQVAELVRTGKHTPMTAQHARHVIEIIERGYAAAESGQTQQLETTFEFPPRFA
jgi:predicted dehydrogenase